MFLSCGWFQPDYYNLSPVNLFHIIGLCEGLMGKLGSGVKRQRQDKQWSDHTIHPEALSRSLALSRTHTNAALCLSCVTYKQERGCLSFLGSVNILNTNKFLWSEREEKLTPSGQLHSHYAVAFDVLQRELIMKASYFLILLIGAWM